MGDDDVLVMVGLESGLVVYSVGSMYAYIYVLSVWDYCGVVCVRWVDYMEVLFWGLLEGYFMLFVR